MDQSYLCLNMSGTSFNDETGSYNDSMANCTLSTTSRASVTGYINAAFMLVFFTIGLPWNALVIGIIFNKKLHTRPSVMLLLNLAVNHLLICLLIMPITFLFGVGYEGIHRERQKVCRTGVTFVWLPSVSIYTVALMSVDRVIYLKKPLTYTRIVTPRRMLISIIVIWVFSTLVSLPPLFGLGEVGYDDNLVTCTLMINDYGPYFLLLTVLGILAHLVKLFGFGYIIFIIRKHLLRKLRRSVGSIRGHGRMRVDTEANSKGMRSQKSSGLVQYKRGQLQLLKVFGAIFTVSFIALLPFISAGVLIPIFDDNADVIPVHITYRISYIMVLAKSVIYPILESYMTRETRDAFLKFCPACVKCRQEKRGSDKVALPKAEAGSSGNAALQDCASSDTHEIATSCTCATQKAINS
jgi:hypothetical protein